MNRLKKTDDVRINAIHELLPPLAHLYELPISDAATELVVQTRQEIADLVHGKDNRLLVIIGPCSIHDPKAAIEYAKRLLPLRQKYAKELLIVMRVYFEKPRTTVGWKGLINDPHLNGTFDINFGLRQARKLLLELNNMGMPASTEFLDMITPQYYADLISWGAIGARTTESQVHRELSRAYLALWVLKTAQMAISKLPLMPLVQPIIPTTSYRLPEQDILRLYTPAAIPIAM